MEKWNDKRSAWNIKINALHSKTFPLFLVIDFSKTIKSSIEKRMTNELRINSLTRAFNHPTRLRNDKFFKHFKSSMNIKKRRITSVHHTTTNQTFVFSNSSTRDDGACATFFFLFRYCVCTVGAQSIIFPLLEGSDLLIFRETRKRGCFSRFRMTSMLNSYFVIDIFFW